MSKRRTNSITNSMVTFLATTGERGATLQEIYAAVNADLGKDVLHTSIRAILYRRLDGAKSKYIKRFQRSIVHGNYRYRLL